MTDKPKEPSAIVLPFGKHKGKTVAELLAIDPAYADWVMAQGWVAERFAELHAAIASRGAGQDDTPEHNALQARFLDKQFCAAFLTLTGRLNSRRTIVSKRLAEDKEYNLKVAQANLNEIKKDYWLDREPADEYQKTRVSQSRDNLAAAQAKLLLAENSLANPSAIHLVLRVTFENEGRDVVIAYDFTDKDSITQFSFEVTQTYNPIASIELKPSLGDDYPTVMRQMKRLRASSLVIQNYTGRGVALPDLRQMFTANGQTLVTVQEIEAAMREA